MTKVRGLFLFLIFYFHGVSFAQVVLIDPGHGGEELGALSRIWVKGKAGVKTRNIYEKNLALILAKKVKAKLEKKYTTYLTRSFDRTVSLHERAKMADTVKADLFVSIHFNSSWNKKSQGFETYYLDNHDQAAIRKVEKVENKGRMGMDKVINQILIDLVVQKTVKASKKLANLIHTRVRKRVGKRFKLRDRGVKPGLFYVLALSKRPGVLIEAGFMSNPRELKVVKSYAFLNAYAKAIAEGIVSYMKTLPPKDLPLF